MSFFSDVQDALLHLAFPLVCEGCGSDQIDKAHLLCIRCEASLPKTNFHLYPGIPVEKIFWGRLPVTHASSLFYFTKESMIQQLMHSFKYRANKGLGMYLGKLMGSALADTNRYAAIDALLPLPLFPEKERARGFNQAAVLCEGISSVLHKPVLYEVVKRTFHTETQTKKNRAERWKNMEGRFLVVNPAAVEGRHILLVDDVLTTGATLEACGKEIFNSANLQLSIATLCFSSGN